jgi:ectoine hydroxylase-related dioxygenase (phytanoyl-CoA dioxygenase family)
VTRVATRYLTDEQVAAYRRDGYLAVPELIDKPRIEALREVTAEFVERSRSVSTSDNLFDLDPRHTAAAPELRRLKNPADNDPLYRWVAFESPIADVVAELIGPDVKFHHSKLNLKGSHGGAPVDWHQDAAFYPHSNDDVLAVGLLLDDADAANGAMSVLPGSHFGPVYEHYAGDRFVGSMQAADVARLDLGRARLLELPAGSIHIHHYRLVHGSAPNLSARPRRLLINAYRAADAIPFTADNNHSPLYGRLVRGREARVARRQAGDIRMPPDFSEGYTSIYELQTRPSAR